MSYKWDAKPAEGDGCAAEWVASYITIWRKMMKKKILYAAAVLAALLFIWLGNEGSKPLVLKGTDLNQTAGVSDYTG